MLKSPSRTSIESPVPDKMSENAYFALVYSCIMSNSIVIVLSVTLPCCLYMCYSIWASWERLLTIMLENLVSLPRKSGSPLYPQNIRHSSPGCPTAIFLLAQGQWKVLQGGQMARRNGQAEPALVLGKVAVPPQLAVCHRFNEVVFAPLHT